MSAASIAGRPEPSEHLPYYEKYIRLVTGEDALAALASQTGETLATLRAVSEVDSLKRYAPGKWSLREVIGHVTDAERVFAYRALRIARGDATPLAGFEQDDWMAEAHFDARSLRELLDEFQAVRQASVLLFRPLDQEAWRRRGVASGGDVSVRALAFIIAGHERHHMAIVREKYLPLVG